MLKSDLNGFKNIYIAMKYFWGSAVTCIEAT